MYNKIECVSLSCNNCGESFIEGHNGYSIFVDEQSAHEYADSEGWSSRDDKHYCPSCHTIDEDDNLIINLNKTDKA